MKFLADSKVYFLATTDGVGGRVRPFGFAMDYKGKLYFVTAKNKEVYQQLTEHPDCEICACSPTMQWLRVKGMAVFDDSRSAKEAVFTAMPGLKYLYKDGADDPIVAPFWLDSPEAVIMDMSGGFKQIQM